MTSEKTRKALFKDYTKCHYMKVNAKGKILKDVKIDVEYVDLDKNGNVYVEWRFDTYSKLESTEVNVVRYASYGYDGFDIEGVFTSKKEALAIAAEWFNEEKKKKIAKLEAELAELKK